MSKKHKKNAKAKNKTDKGKHSWRSHWKKFKLKTDLITDVVIFCFLIISAIVVVNFNLSSDITSQKVSFAKPKSPKKVKKIKIPKAEVAMGNAYEFVPKKKVTKYKTAYNYYGAPYKKKLKHPKVKYLAHFYLDPNYASKAEEVQRPIYVLLEGTITSKIKTPKPKQINFANGSLAFDGSKHFVLNDSYRYTQVMQFLTYRRYDTKTMPNEVMHGVNQMSVKGSTRYLKLSEFELKRVKNVNLSKFAQNQQLFCGFEQPN